MWCDIADGESNVSNELSELQDGDVFQQGDLRAVVEVSPSRVPRQAGNSLPIFTASVSKWAFLYTLQLTKTGV